MLDKQGLNLPSNDISSDVYWAYNVNGPLQHTLNKQIAVTIVMWLLVVFAAIGAVYSKHVSRISHAKLQILYDDTVSLKNEHGKLLLEKAAWTTEARVEQVAKGKLNMVMPSRVEIIKP